MLEKFDRPKRFPMRFWPMWFWLDSCTFPIKKRSPADPNAVYDAGNHTARERCT